MHHKIKKIFFKTASIQTAFVVLFLIYAISDSSADDWDKFLDYNPQKITPSEFQALPDYCQTKLYYHHLKGEEGRKSKKNKKLRQVFGSDYDHLHHYCWGIVKLNRAKMLKIDDAKRDYWLKFAAGEFNYIIKHAAKNSPFLWMYHQKRGEALMLRNNIAGAKIEFKKAEYFKKKFQK